jgi:glutamate/tyrosine decarboxylase-like PLP-dependent enzyme
MPKKLKIPKTGINREQLLVRMAAEKNRDADWSNGRSWSLVYYAGDQHTECLKEAYCLFFSENGLSPTAFPSLREFESEVVAMVLNLLGASDGEVGTMTSGGTESILLAVKSYRDWARVHRPEIKHPEMLVPVSAHPAFLKAGQYFDVKTTFLPVDHEFRADLRALSDKFSDQTICLIASAPSFPQGVVDPIHEMGEFAREHNVGLHVDACLGGFMLPFIRKLGYHVPDFDFRVPGVTSISADLHKYGYAAKGASVALYRSNQLRRFQFFATAEWPGGMYGSPTMAGTRPGGAIAAAWAALMSLGEKGYLEFAKQTMDLTRTLIEGIEATPGFYVIGKPDMSVFTFAAKDLDIFGVGDRLEKKGWRMDRQKNPDCLHMIVTPNHSQSVEPFLEDLRDGAAEERRNPTRLARGEETMLYGVTSNVPANVNLQNFIRTHMDEMYTI